MKIRGRILSVVLAIALLCSLSVTAFAAPGLSIVGDIVAGVQVIDMIDEHIVSPAVDFWLSNTKSGQQAQAYWDSIFGAPVDDSGRRFSVSTRKGFGGGRAAGFGGGGSSDGDGSLAKPVKPSANSQYFQIFDTDNLADSTLKKYPKLATVLPNSVAVFQDWDKPTVRNLPVSGSEIVKAVPKCLNYNSNGPSGDNYIYATGKRFFVDGYDSKNVGWYSSVSVVYLSVGSSARLRYIKSQAGSTIGVPYLYFLGTDSSFGKLDVSQYSSLESLSSYERVPYSQSAYYQDGFFTVSKSGYYILVTPSINSSFNNTINPPLSDNSIIFNGGNYSTGGLKNAHDFLNGLIILESTYPFLKNPDSVGVNDGYGDYWAGDDSGTYYLNINDVPLTSGLGILSSPNADGSADLFTGTLRKQDSKEIYDLQQKKYVSYEDVVYYGNTYQYNLSDGNYISYDFNNAGISMTSGSTLTGDVTINNYYYYASDELQKQYSDDKEENSTNLLSSLGKAIGTLFGSLIEAVGQIATGIVDGLTGLVDDIVKLIGNVLTLPSELANTFTSIFSFLPSEVSGIIVAGFALFVLVAIIKFLRG